MEKLTLSVRELAKVLGVSETSAYRLVHTKGFPRLCIGRRYLIPMEELNHWIAENVAEWERR